MDSFIEYLSKHEIEQSIWKQLHTVLQNKEFNKQQKRAYISGMFTAYSNVDPTNHAKLAFFPVDVLFIDNNNKNESNLHKKRKRVVIEDEADETIEGFEMDIPEHETCSEDETWNENTFYKEAFSTETLSRFFRIDKIVNEKKGIIDITWLYTQEEMVDELVSRGDITQSQKIKREYGAHVLWLSTHNQKGYHVCGELESIQDKIIFDKNPERRSMRGRYQITELFDLDTLIRHVIPQEDDTIDWKKRFAGLIENALSRGTQMGTSEYTPAKLLELIQTKGPQNMIVENSPPKQSKCEICGALRQIKSRIRFITTINSPSLELDVGSSCLLYIVLAHKMCHYKELELSPVDLQEEYTTLINTK